MVGTLRGSCARAASGDAAAAPPRIDVNARLFTRSPRQPLAQLFSARATRPLRGRDGCLGLPEGNYGSPSQRIDSTQRPKLPSLRCA